MYIASVIIYIFQFSFGYTLAFIGMFADTFLMDFFPILDQIFEEI
jgi:hypothetical protein